MSEQLVKDCGKPVAADEPRSLHHEQSDATEFSVTSRFLNARTLNWLKAVVRQLSTLTTNHIVMIDQRPRQNRMRIYGGFAVITALLVGYWWISGSRFDSNTWKSVTGNDASKLAMVDDLLARYRLIGMERAEIDELLGVPPDTPYFADSDYVYWLGPERGLISIDSEWLCIDFKDDVVVDAKLMRD